VNTKKLKRSFLKGSSIVRIIGVVLAGALALTLASSISGAGTIIDIRGAGDVPINGGIFAEFTLEGSTGTGTFQPFLHVNATGNPVDVGVEEGYNTDHDPLEFDETPQWTYPVELTELPVVDYGGTLYIEFVLDTNQNKGGPGGINSLLTFEDLELYMTDDPLIYPYTALGTGAAPMVWDLDSGGDVAILHDGQYASGSGQGDMRILIPYSVFSYDLDFVIAFVRFGDLETYPNNDGFEEFGYIIYPTEPDTQVQISADPMLVIHPGGIVNGTTNLTVIERNTGNEPLYNVQVVVDDGFIVVATLDETTAIESVTDDNILEENETWTWNVSTNPELSVAVVNETTFAATGYAETVGGTPVTIPDHPDEYAEVTVELLDTDVGIVADPMLVIQTGGGVNGKTNLTVSEANNGSVDLTNVTVLVKKDGVLIATLTSADTHTGDGGVAGTLEAGETWTWAYGDVGALANIEVTDTTVFSATASVDYGGSTYSLEDADEYEDITVYTLSTDVGIDSDVYETVPGGNVQLEVQEHNDGDLPLYDVQVLVEYDSTTLVVLDKDNVASGDGGVSGVLEVGETWVWDYLSEPLLNPMVYVDTTFTATGSAWYYDDPITPTISVEVTYPDDEEEQDSVLVEVGGATRTWGFWKTHLWLVQYMLGGSTLLDPLDPYYTEFPIVTLPINLGDWGQGDRLIDGDCRYMALMWAKQSQNSDRKPREAIDKARIHTAHQALAAIMNSYMPGGAPLPGGMTIADIADTLEKDNIQDIRDLGSDLADFNESGDDIALDPSLPPTGKTNNADPQGGRLVGEPCAEYWDTPERIKGNGRGRRK
jgi:hypothetical protein